MCLFVVSRMAPCEGLHSDDGGLCTGPLRDLYTCRRAAVSVGCGCAPVVKVCLGIILKPSEAVQ